MCQVGFVGDCIDCFQLWFYGCNVVLFDVGFVYVSGVVIVDQFVVIVGLCVVGGIFQDGVGVGQGFFGNDVEVVEV